MSDPEGADGMGGGDGTEGTGASTGTTGSYGRPGHSVPDPKQPVTSMDTAAADDDGDADSRDDPAAHGGPDLRDLPSTESGTADDQDGPARP